MDFSDFSSVLEFSPGLLFWACSLDGLFLYVSPSVFSMLGYTSDELLGYPISQFFHPNDDFSIPDFVSSLSLGDSRDFVVFRFRSKDGFYVWLTSSVQLTTTKDNVSTVLVGVSRDITKNVRVEEDLRNSKNNLQLAQRIAHMGHWDRDVIRNEVYCSDEVYRIFGISAEEFKLTPELFVEFFHDSDKSYVSHVLETSGKTYDVEFRIVRADGEVRVVRSVGEKILDDSGLHIRSFGTIQDITEQKQSDEVLRRSEKLAVAGELAAAIAHEIRNPLTVVQGFLQLLKEQSTQDPMEYIDLALNELHRTEVIIKDYLDVARPQIERVDVFDAERVIQNVLVVMTSYAAMHSVDLRAH